MEQQDTMQNDLSPPSFSTPSYVFTQSTTQQKKATKRKRELNYTPASSLNLHDIDTLFGNVKYEPQTFPHNNKGPVNTGDTPCEALQCILQDLTVANLSVSTIGDILRCVDEEVPFILREKVNDFTKRWRYVLGGFSYDGSTLSKAKESYRILEQHIIDKHRTISPRYLPSGPLLSLKHLCSNVNKEDFTPDEKASAMHTSLKELWVSVFRLALGSEYVWSAQPNASPVEISPPNIPDRVTPPLHTTRPHMYHQEQISASATVVRQKIIMQPQILTKGMAVHKFKLKPDLRYVASVTTCTEKHVEGIEVWPDMCINMYFGPEEEPGVIEEIPKTCCRILCVGVKTTGLSVDAEHNSMKADTPSESDEEPILSTSSSPQQSHVIPSRMNSLRTQHFAELLAFIKDKRASDSHDLDKLSGNVKSFGLYIVMNRVYITCLNVDADSKRSFMSHSEYQTKYEFLNKQTYENNSRQPNFRMVATKYLNIFKPSHMEALVKFIQYLVWHEYVHMMDG